MDICRKFPGAEFWTNIFTPYPGAPIMDKIEELGVHTPDSLVGLAASDQQIHNYNEAIAIYESINKAAPQLIKQNPALLYNLGQAYQGANQPQKAKGVYTAFLTYLKPGTQGYTQVKGLIASIDHPGSQ